MASESNTIARKQCQSCTKSLYLSRFEKDVSELDGLKPMCIACEEKLHDLEFCEKVHSMIRTMDSTALVTLQGLSNKTGVQKQNISLPHAATLLEDIMTVWGGSEGFSQHLMAEYLAAQPGSQMRHSTIKAILALVKFVSEQNYVTQPLESMSDDQLEDYYQQRRKDLQQKLGVYDGKVVSYEEAG